MRYGPSNESSARIRWPEPTLPRGSSKLQLVNVILVHVLDLKRTVRRSCETLASLPNPDAALHRPKATQAVYRGPMRRRLRPYEADGGGRPVEDRRQL